MSIASRERQELAYFFRGFWIAILATVMTGHCLTAAEDPAPQNGLRGLLPEGIPVELTGAIAMLPENWKAWGTALNDDLAALYEKPDADSSAQRLAIAALRKRVATAHQYVVDPQYRSILNTLVSISSGLQRRLDIAEAALDRVDQNPDLRQSMKELLAAIEDYESVHSTASAAAVRKSFAAVPPVASDGSDKLDLAVRKHYFNYNL